MVNITVVDAHPRHITPELPGSPQNADHPPIREQLDGADKFRAWAGPRLAAADQERALQRLPGICQLLCAELQGAG